MNQEVTIGTLLHCQVVIMGHGDIDLPSLSSLTIFNNFEYAGEFTATSMCIMDVLCRSQYRICVLALI